MRSRPSSHDGSTAQTRWPSRKHCTATRSTATEVNAATYTRVSTSAKSRRRLAPRLPFHSNAAGLEGDSMRRVQYARLQSANGSTSNHPRCTRTRPIAAMALPPVRTINPHEYASRMIRNRPIASSAPVRRRQNDPISSPSARTTSSGGASSISAGGEFAIPWTRNSRTSICDWSIATTPMADAPHARPAAGSCVSPVRGRAVSNVRTRAGSWGLPDPPGRLPIAGAWMQNPRS